MVREQEEQETSVKAGGNTGFLVSLSFDPEDGDGMFL
jgi:hypothetical protein